MHFSPSLFQYLQIARKLPSYGCIKFTNATADYPRPNSLVNILIGNKELSIQTTTTDGKCQETTFKITRMRCWRITTNYNVCLNANFLRISTVLVYNIFWIIIHLFHRTKMLHHIHRPTAGVTAAVAQHVHQWNYRLNI